MTGPLSGSNKPGEEDSWESLAEDLFGIDFHGGSAEDDLPDDEEDFAPAAVVVGSADSADGEDELEAGFPEEDEEEAEAGFPEAEAEDEHDGGFAEPDERMPAKAERSKPSSPPEERDSFWDALNDWDWSEAPRRQKPPVPLTSIVDQEEVPAKAPASERKDEPGERRRRRRGRRRSSVTEPVTASEEPAPIPQRDPEPLPALEDEFELAAGDEDDDEFGAGLLEPARRPSRRPKAPSEPAKRPAGRPSAERGTRAPARGERSRPVEEPARPSPRPVAEDAEGAGFGDDLDEGEQRPARRRRRRRRRPAESTEAVSPTIDETSQPPEDIELRSAERPRRRSRTVREQPVEEARPSQAAATRPGSGVVPTWAEAIALLVHRHPKQTTGWTPEPDEGGSERPSRPQSNGGRRRRRRSS